MELSFGNPRSAPVLAALLCGGSGVTLSFAGTGAPQILHLAGGALSAPISAAVRIVTAGGSAASSLLGTDVTQQLEVSEWLEFASTTPQPAFLEKLDVVLRVRTYLAGSSFSLADIVAFTVVAGACLPGRLALVGRPLTYSILLRWLLFTDLNRADVSESVRRWLGLCESRLPLEAADALAAAASPLTAVAGRAGKAAAKAAGAPPPASAAGGAKAAGAARAGGDGAAPPASGPPKSSHNIGGGGKEGAMPVLKGVCVCVCVCVLWLHCLWHCLRDGVAPFVIAPDPRVRCRRRPWRSRHALPPRAERLPPHWPRQGPPPQRVLRASLQGPPTPALRRHEPFVSVKPLLLLLLLPAGAGLLASLWSSRQAPPPPRPPRLTCLQEGEGRVRAEHHGRHRRPRHHARLHFSHLGLLWSHRGARKVRP
jgi:hypothetical protein